MRRRLATTAVLLVTVLSAVGLVGLTASPAHADPLCYKVQTIDNIPHVTVGPYCVTQYPLGVECTTQYAELYPTAGVLVYYCIP
jgi:hypothetical protein